MPALGGIDQVDPDLGVLDPAGGAGVLALHPDGVGALLQIAGLVHHQHRVGIGEVIHDVSAQVVTHRVGVPGRASQQVLHAVRRRLTGVLGDRPAVHPRQPGQQPQHEQPDPPTRFNPGEPARDPLHQLVETDSAIDQGLRCGTQPPRRSSCSPHNSGSSSGGRATSGTATPPDHGRRAQ